VCREFAGAEHVINWELASDAECRQLFSKFKQIELTMEPPFVVETVARGSAASSGNGDLAEEGEGAEAEEKGREKNPRSPRPSARSRWKWWRKTNPRDLFEYVKKEGSRGYECQRYKAPGRNDPRRSCGRRRWIRAPDPASVRLEDFSRVRNDFFPR